MKRPCWFWPSCWPSPSRPARKRRWLLPDPQTKPEPPDEPEPPEPVLDTRPVFERRVDRIEVPIPPPGANALNLPVTTPLPGARGR